MNNPKIAIVHEWFVDYSGSEKVVEQLINCFPDANLFALIEFLPEKLKFFIKNKPVTTSFIQHLPFAKKNYRSYFPLMPLAIEQLNTMDCDIVITSNHAVSKGVITNSNQLTICYCHSPIRYAWDLYFNYLEKTGLNRGLKGIVAKYFLHKLRLWDLASAQRVDYFIANSKYIAKRIKKIYQKDAVVIYPPVDINQFELKVEKQDFYLTSSRLVQYKRIDLIVEAFNQMPDKKLIVIGEGPDYKKIKKSAKPNVEVLGFQEKEILINYMQNAKGFVFAAEEDFGITPVEAQACGTPVIAYGKGGCLETIIENQTGLFFEHQTVESLKTAIERFESTIHLFIPSQVRINAERFGNERFSNEIKDFVNQKYKEFLLS